MDNQDDDGIMMDDADPADAMAAMMINPLNSMVKSSSG